MAGSVLSQTKTFQPAEESNISSVVCVASIRQPNASSTANPQIRLQLTANPRGTGWTDAFTVSLILQRSGTTATGSTSISTSIITNNTAQSWDTGWVTASALTNTTGSDTWIGRLYYENQGQTDEYQLSVSMSGQIYWTQPVTTNYTVTYNANGGSTTPSSQTQ